MDHCFQTIPNTFLSIFNSPLILALPAKNIYIIILGCCPSNTFVLVFKQLQVPFLQWKFTLRSERIWMS